RRHSEAAVSLAKKARKKPVGTAPKGNGRFDRPLTKDALSASSTPKTLENPSEPAPSGGWAGTRGLCFRLPSAHFPEIGPDGAAFAGWIERTKAIRLARS